jgi:hypothetical protein
MAMASTVGSSIRPTTSRSTTAGGSISPTPGTWATSRSTRRWRRSTATTPTARPGIRIYDPEGKEIAEIPTELPTNVGFGRGADANLLYITAGKSLYRIRLNRRGHHPAGPETTPDASGN